MSNNKQTLILGGARSGKSQFAENLAHRISTEKESQKVYIATATAGDGEMAERIRRHKEQRDSYWQLIEEPIALGAVIKRATRDQCLLIDCLTLWLSNCLYNECWPEQKASLLEALQITPADIIMVSNEVGSGVIPMGELSRNFVDESGWLHQTLAQQCSHVSQIIAGLENTLKGEKQ